MPTDRAMDRLISYKKREWVSDDEVIYSDCTLNPGVSMKIESEGRRKLMFAFHVEDQEVQYFFEDYEPAELHAMYDELGPKMVLPAFVDAGGSEKEWLALTHEQQVYLMLMCYDYCTDTFDMSEFDPSVDVDQ